MALELPNGPRGIEGRYRLKDVTTDTRQAELVYDFQGQSCALPVLMDHYWIQAVDPRYVTTLDFSNPARPREVARLELEPKDDPHWMAREPYGRRIVITGGNPLKTDGLFGRVLIGSAGEDGNITLDARLKDPATGKPGIRLDRASAHGAVFSVR